MITAFALMLAQTPAAAPVPPMEEAANRIAARDAELFWYAFEGCDAAKLGELLTGDFRMLHDQGGLVADSRAQFTGMIEEQCAARLPGGVDAGYKNRRLLVPGSDAVTPLGRWGVLHRGYHTFHEWGGPEKGWVRTGGAYFINVWRWQADPEDAAKAVETQAGAAKGRFVMQQTISVDHGAAPSYPPAF